MIKKKLIKNSKKIWMKIKLLLNDNSGGSMLESGLLIALSLILFLMLIGIVTNIYNWIEEQFISVISYFEGI
ncbi:MAG: hypothetical protein K9W44_02825 [Candidatus Lokiarchaeota archaeon]|nr:hypothetical protein [Candidatus Harpocratesius repetitus]